MRSILVCASALVCTGCDSNQARQQEFYNSPIAVGALDSVLDASDSLLIPLSDARLLIGIQLLEAFGQFPPQDTMTITDILDWARDADRRKREKQEEADRLAAEERARADALAARLDSVLVVAVARMGFQPKDYRANRYEDYITIRFVYENKGSQAIRAFEGLVTFLDLFGDKIYSANLKVDERLEAGATRRNDRTIDYNQFVDEHQLLRSTELENMRVVWQPSTVIFDDGTIISLEDN